MNLLVLLAKLLGFFRFLVKAFLGHGHRCKVHGIVNDKGRRLFCRLFIRSIVVTFVTFLFAFYLVRVVDPCLGFGLFGCILVVRGGLLFVRATRCVMFVLFLYVVLYFVAMLHVRCAPVRARVRNDRVGHRGRKVQGVLLNVRFFVY